MDEGTVIAISVGVGTAVLVIILALIAVFCQKKLNKRDVEDDKEKLEDEVISTYEFEDERKVQAGKRKVQTTATQTSISHTYNVFATKSSSIHDNQYQNMFIPKMESNLPFYAGQVKQAESKPRIVTEREQKEIINNLKKQYPTKPIPVVVISEPKEKKRQECYVDNWLRNQTSSNFSSVASRVNKYNDDPSDRQTEYDDVREQVSAGYIGEPTYFNSYDPHGYKLEQAEVHSIPRPALRL